MLKRLVLQYWPLVLLLVLIVAILGMSRYAEHRKAENQEYAQASGPEATVTPSETDKGGKPTKKPKYPPSWVDTFAWPEGVTGWALFLTLLVIAWQSVETRRAAQSAERQTTLQSAALRQWVNVVPMGIDISRKLENPCEVTLQFEILNKTDYLVTIKGVEFELIPNIHDIGKFKVDCDFALAPRTRDLESAFPFTGKCVIDVGELDGWGKIFIVAGDVKFLDCMDRDQVQHFQDLYRGFIDGRLERMKPSSIQSTEENREHPQNPN
ncbi:MAG: hypothetical protein WCA21_02525 [Terracidiphilus sp.]